MIYCFFVFKINSLLRWLKYLDLKLCLGVENIIFELTCLLGWRDSLVIGWVTLAVVDVVVVSSTDGFGVVGVFMATTLAMFDFTRFWDKSVASFCTLGFTFYFIWNYYISTGMAHGTAALFVIYDTFFLLFFCSSIKTILLEFFSSFFFTLKSRFFFNRTMGFVIPENIQIHFPTCVFEPHFH